MISRWLSVLVVLLCLLLPLGLLFLSGNTRETPLSESPTTERPRLVVLVVFDQMRGDYPQRWRELYDEGGLRRLEDEGAWFQNCHVAYANSSTGPWHASLLT